MRNMAWKLIFIFALIALCIWSVNPPSERIRLGKDLRGGVSLIYKVNFEEDESADRAAIVTQMISVLQERVNPTGVLDISMQPLGNDRIEIVMPLPTEEVLNLRKAYEKALESILERAEIPASELDASLRLGNAVAQFGGEPGSDQYESLSDLQAAFTTLQAAQKAYDEAIANEADSATLNPLSQALAAASIAFENQRQDVLQHSLDRAVVIRMLNLSKELQNKVDEKNEPVLDEETGEQVLTPSPQDVLLTSLKDQFSHLSTELDALVELYDEFQSKRVGFDDPEDLKRLLRGAGVLEFRIAVRAGSIDVPIDDLRTQLEEKGPDNISSEIAGWFEINDLKQWYDTTEERELLEANPQNYFASRYRLNGAVKDGRYYLLIYRLPEKIMTHSDHSPWRLERAFPTVDNIGRPAVGFRLDAVGGSRMRVLTQNHLQQPMAILLDNQVYSAPNLQSAIGRSGIVQGSFSQEDINYLIRVLAAGALEARLSPEPIAVNNLGPSIGADNLNRGLWAFVISLIAVTIFMVFYYFFAGFVADLALIANGVIIFGFMAMIQGTFTLPGLAGIVLTIGMAVDANVLIYERIREEIFGEDDIDLKAAIRLGYSKALSTIIDANVTNLIVCFVLAKTATTEVKGFATTLSIGICATLFTSLFVTRQIYYLYTDFFKLRSLQMLPILVPAIHRTLEPAIAWISLRKVFWTISGIAMVGSIVLVSSRGVEMLDTEFRGGVTATMVLRQQDMNGDGTIGDEERLQLPHEQVVERIHNIPAKLGIEAPTPAQMADAAKVLDAAEQVRRSATEENIETATMALEQAEDAYSALVSRLAVMQMANASVLTAGEVGKDPQTSALTASRFQIKVASPPGVADDRTISDYIVNALLDEFGDQLQVTPPLTYDGAGDLSRTVWTQRTFAVTTDSLGENISNRRYTESVSAFIGGVIVLLEDIEPSATVEDLTKRIGDMRAQPDFSDTATRTTQVIGLEPADPSNPDSGYVSAAVVVFDKDLNLSSPDVTGEVWDTRVAEREWALVNAALTQQSSLEQVSSFSSAVAATLKAQATVAVILSLLGILVYIWVRFGSLRYSLAAIIALVHDVTIAMGLLAATHWLGESSIGRALAIEVFRIDLGVVAALLTIIGYSLNDTIVILDRIRENRGKRPLASAAIINRSINQTISRTLLTSFTTLLAVGIMYFEGGSGIRPFTFCLLTGLIVGTYSSVAIAAPLVYSAQEKNVGSNRPSGD
jgi:SecD/SecF fusion protein